VGTTKTTAIIAEYGDSGALAITGVGTSPSAGLRRGVVVNIESTMQSVAQAVEAAELMSGREVAECAVGIAGANIEGINSRGVVAVSGRGREITGEDVNRVMEAARAVAIPMDRDVLHVIPQTFIVDDQRGIRDPLDMIGVRLEAEVHIITCSVTTAQNLVKCVNRAGFKVQSLTLQSLAAARATLGTDERELGCVLLDLGGGTTDILVYAEGAPYYSNVIPVGGVQVTNDLSIMLAISMEAAERLKRDHACCHGAMVEDDEPVIVPGVGGRAPRTEPKSRIASIVQPRMEEIFRLARERIEKPGYLSKVKGGVVLTGGGAKMPGAAELASEIFGLPARVGNPVALGGLVGEYRGPEFATAVGLVMEAAAKGEEPEAPKSKGEARERKPSIASRMMEWMKREFF
jgi:cell division protein FtsA